MRKALAIAALVLSALPAVAQLKLPRVSQHQTLTQTVGLTDITINYSRPGVKGREVWGALVPWAKVWRTGANEATTIKFTDDVTINGQKLPAGTYSLHTVPGRDEWIVIFNSVADQWGSYSYDEKKDALRVNAKPQKSDFHEWLTFDFPQIADDSATIAIKWENVSVPFTVGVDTRTKAMANVKAALAAAKADDWQTRYRAASYANDIGDTAEANAWIEDALKVKPTMQAYYLKARMQAKAGDKAGARASAAQALKLAGADDKVVVEEIQRAMESWK